MKTWLFILALCLTGQYVKAGEQTEESSGIYDLLKGLLGVGGNKDSTRNQPRPASLVTQCPVNVMFVLDGSDSVSPDGYQAAKASLIREMRAVTQTFANTSVGVIQFSDVTEEIPLQERTSAELENLIAQVQNLRQPRKKTSLSNAFGRARELLQEYSFIESRAFNGIQSGSIIVLLTDGYTDSKTETLKEAKQAKNNKMLVVSLTLESADHTLLNSISHVVQEHTTAINWTSQVACPGTILPPVVKLPESVCRDFLLVVDGSDSVLRQKETVRQYLAYTALRYRRVNNAIGVNVYGTNSQSQAANTRIRLDDDKYELADKIQAKLEFPTSGGTGTNVAVTQSVNMLDEDLRDRPSALILITDGPTVDQLATRNAIQDARSKGYQVLIVRVGYALTDQELTFISGGNMTSVFSVGSFTQLFGLNFDGQICSNTVPNPCPLPCPFEAVQAADCSCRCNEGRVFNTASRTCECTPECPDGTYRISNCGCQCTDVNMRYNSFTNECDRVACAFCPPNAVLQNDCSCICPTGQVFNQSSRTCECPREYHTGVYRIIICDCNCTGVNTRYNSFSNQCVPAGSTCLQSCPFGISQAPNCSCLCNEGRVFNTVSRTCECPRLCPTGANRINNCDCNCTGVNTRYNSFSNQCDCTQICPFNANRVGTCDCRCNDNNMRYDSATNQCVPIGTTCPQSCPFGISQAPNCSCLCNEGRVFNTVSRTCECPRLCPTGANRINNCDCNCTGVNTRYNSFSNQCDCTQICPFNANRVGTCDCRCNDNNMRYDSATNQCVPIGTTCPQSCPFGISQAPNCSCLCNEGRVFNTVSRTCECPRLCPTGANRINNCDCNCTGVNTRYNSFSNQCDCTQICPFNANRVGTCDCRCNDNNMRYDSATNQCVPIGTTCPQSCPFGISQAPNCSCLCNEGRVFNTVSRTCECPRLCPTGANRINNCDCNCTGVNTRYNSFSNQCDCTQICPFNANRVGTCDCRCNDNNMRYDSATNQCVPECTQSCPFNAYRVNICGCQCNDNNMRYNSATNQCECPRLCPTGANRINICDCNCTGVNTRYNSFSNQCDCTQSCPYNANRVGTCDCRCNDNNMRYDSATNQCVPIGSTCPQSCPFSISQASNCSCLCTDGRVFNTVSRTCECPRLCPTGAYRINICDCNCTGVNTRYNSFSNQCEPIPCLQSCPFGTSQASNCSCLCTDGRVFNPVSRTCVPDCPQTCPFNAYRVSTCDCRCNDNNMRYDSATNQCVSRDPCPYQCPSPASRGSSCTCICPVGQIYNENTRTCVTPCTCPSNATPVQPCSCLCPTGQIFNQITRTCDIIQTPCTASELTCENNQLAYKDCNGRCFCSCSPAFAGPRCEIVVQANLCDDCFYTNGHYIAGVNGYCDLYVNCVPIGGMPNSTARPAAFSPFVMHCPTNTYYITRDDGWSGCDFLENGRCSSDRCSTLPANARYADTSSCQSYWQCGASGRLASRECCPAGQRFDSSSSSCVSDSSCPVSCGVTRTSNCGGGNGVVDTGCPFEVNSSNPNQYYHKTVPGARYNCLPKMIMNVTLCRCTEAVGIPTVCEPTVNLIFEQSSSSVENHVPRILFGGSYVANFSGSDNIILKMFAGSGFWTDYFEIRSRVYLPGGVFFSGQMAVITNADCDTQESVSITVDSQNFYFKIFQIDSTQPVEITIPYASRASSDGWYSVALLYRRTGSGQFEFSASVGNYREIYRGATALTANIDPRTCALHVGYGYRYSGLIGYVDDVQVWRCDPQGQ